jgi:SGNH domain (fused to AT3 domains)
MSAMTFSPRWLPLTGGLICLGALAGCSSAPVAQPQSSVAVRSASASSVRALSPIGAKASSSPDANLQATGYQRAGSFPNPAQDPAHVDVSTVRPALAHAASSLPIVYPDGCHVFAQQVSTARICVFGDVHATKSIVMIGDSHMAQWFPAFDAAARSEHLKLLYLTKSSCPAQLVSVRVYQGTAYYRECDLWRDRAFALIKKQKHIQLIVMGGFAHPQLVKRHTDIPILSPAARAKEWRAGTRRTVLALRGVAPHIVVLRDTPLMQLDGAHCLLDNSGDNAACATPYAKASAASFWRAEHQIATEYPYVSDADFTSSFCTPTRCRPVTSTGILRWRDQGHMTAVFSKMLAPRVRVMIRKAIAGQLID